MEDAVPAKAGEPRMARRAGEAGVALKRRRMDADKAKVETARPIAAEVVQTLAPPSVWHGGQRPLTAPNLRRAGLEPRGFDRQDHAQWEGACPKCHDRFLIKTDTLRATCRCEGVTWRMNVAIITHDFPPHAWHPETIRKTALRSLYARDWWRSGKESSKLLQDLQREFEEGAVFFSILEV